MPNKDLLKVFQNSIKENEAKELLTEVIEKGDATNYESVDEIRDCLFESLKHARSEIRLGERPLRALVRLSFSLMHNFLSRLSEKKATSNGQDSNVTFTLPSVGESSSTRKITKANHGNFHSLPPD